MVVAVTQWLYGCRRLTLQPVGLDNGKIAERQTFDEPQLVLVARQYVEVEEPADVTGGPRPEPTRQRQPSRR